MVYWILGIYRTAVVNWAPSDPFTYFAENVTYSINRALRLVNCHLN